MWNFKTWTLMRCPYKCQITNDRSYLSQASLVLFRLRMLQTIPDKFLREFVQDYDLNDLPKKKYPQQVWVDVNQESPMYSHSDEELLPVDKYMDYIVSYLSQSDYTYAYKSLYRERKERLPPINYAVNKTKTALWYVSHCADLSGRWKYVEELKKYNVSVDVFGKCSGLQDGCKGSKDINCVNTLKAQYKFYLAFENSICSEYITEKYWNILNSSNKMYNIPIALGARLHEYEAVSPENSFLHVRNFTGAKDLAQYIHEIDRDDRKFNSYHSWREKYETYIDKQELLDCWICRMAYEQPKTARPVYSEFWSRKKLCDLTPEPI
ncbi:glycoprotein 3-alpha-L-fucosyltransferase A-like [Watersipora subatra]|uniref:glycoprotein 3-alpha-L-fucosyltransferase A-like n=1 Tax=Watersipora subatra TaxID=2589382 RepID=UPI00355B0C35